MSSAPFDQQPPPALIAQQSYAVQSAHGSIGPVVAVLVVIVILGVAAGMIGRLCSGRSVMGFGQYDLETWAETKCSTCIDGRIGLPPPPRTGAAGNASGSSTPLSVPPQTPRQAKRGEMDESPPENDDS